MKTNRLRLVPACLLIVCAAPLSAQSTHTWVAANGNDANSGTAVSPYADFATAVANTAAGGVVSVVGPGDYGPVTITQSITIDGTGGASIGFAGVGINIIPTSNANVVLRNLTINGGGTGFWPIYIEPPASAGLVNVLIDGCLITGASDEDIWIGNGPLLYVTIKNTTIQGGSVGVRTVQHNPTTTVTTHVSVDHVTIQGPTSAGVYHRNGNMDISNSNITGVSNGNAYGIEADSNATVNAQNSTITSNAYGVCMFLNSTAIIGAGTVIADNTTNIKACGGTVQGTAGAGPSPKL